jgi:hypothetical protein
VDAQVLNFKRYDSGAMAGFFDLSVCGIVVTSCKCFKKPADGQKEDKVWFAWPSEKTTDAAGEAKYRDIVSAAEPIHASPPGACPRSTEGAPGCTSRTASITGSGTS